MSQAVVPPTPASTIAAGICLPLVSGALVGLRFYSKYAQSAKLYVEDWLTIPAFFILFGMGVCLVYGVAHKALAYPTPQPSNPKDVPTFVAPEITINRQVEYAVLLMQVPCITCIKLAFFFLYKRVFCHPFQNYVTYLIWFFIAICTIWGFSIFFTFAFICGTQPSAFWGPLAEFKQHCPHILDWNLVMSTTDFALDIIVFIFPMTLLWRFQMSTTRKLAVIAVFMVGGLTVAASITRMAIFIHAVQNLRISYKSKGAENLIITAGLYWTTFECGMGLIAVCLPLVHSFVKQFLWEHLGFKTSPSNEPNQPSSSKSSSGVVQKEDHAKWDGFESDIIRLGPSVLMTDITIDVESETSPHIDRNSRKPDGVFR